MMSPAPIQITTRAATIAATAALAASIYTGASVYRSGHTAGHAAGQAAGLAMAGVDQGGAVSPQAGARALPLELDPPQRPATLSAPGPTPIAFEGATADTAPAPAPGPTPSVDDAVVVSEYADQIRAVALAHGIDPRYLLALASCPVRDTSGGRPPVVVAEHAAADLNARYDRQLDPSVPADSITLAALYTVETHHVLGGATDPAVLARAWHAGNGAVLRDEPISPETAAHVECVLAAMEAAS